MIITGNYCLVMGPRSLPPPTITTSVVEVVSASVGVEKIMVVKMVVARTTNDTKITMDPTIRYSTFIFNILFKFILNSFFRNGVNPAKIIPMVVNTGADFTVLVVVIILVTAI